MAAKKRPRGPSRTSPIRRSSPRQTTIRSIFQGSGPIPHIPKGLKILVSPTDAAIRAIGEEQVFDCVKEVLSDLDGYCDRHFDQFRQPIIAAVIVCQGKELAVVLREERTGIRVHTGLRHEFGITPPPGRA